MTTIVAIRTDKEVVIGADRLVQGGGGFALSRSTEKIATFGPWFLALAGEHAHLDAASRCADTLAASTDERQFLDRLRAGLDAPRFNPGKPAEGESGWPNYDCSGILARSAVAGAWYFTGDLRPYPLEIGRPMGAGVGRECACAAALAALRCGSSARKAVELGLQVAAEYQPTGGSRHDPPSILLIDQHSWTTA